jgi:hypothetical protein
VAFALFGVALGVAAMSLALQVEFGTLLETPDVTGLGGSLLFAAAGAEFLALGLSIGALFQQDRRRLWAIVGTSVSATIIVGLGLLFAAVALFSPPV